MSDEPLPTLLEVLRRRFPEASTTTLRQMLKADRVRVNGVPERVARRAVAPADRVEVAPRRARPLDPRLRLLYEDEQILVVDKAAGLLSVPSPQVRHESAETFLDAYAGALPGEPRVHHVHRLDRDASGVLVFARGEYVRDRLQERFAAHEVERVYVAVVHGKPRPGAGTLRGFLDEDRHGHVRLVEPGQGKEAVTRFRTIASGRRYAVLEVTLETGRRHQIRVQLAHLGHPIVGDPLYARGLEDPLGRLGLHARDLAFAHPRTGRRMAFTAPVPAAFGDLAL